MKKYLPNPGIKTGELNARLDMLTTALTRHAPFNVTHYDNDNMSMQYTAIFNGCKNGNFQMKNCDIFLIFAQNIDCGYPFKLPH